MPRFVAIHTCPGITEDKFQQTLGAVSSWRPDRRTTILKVYCNLAEGKMVTECEAVEQSVFEDWLDQVGWTRDDVYRVDLIHQAGHIWRV